MKNINYSDSIKRDQIPQFTGSDDIRFGSETKTKQKLMNQILKRGWTKKSIKETVKNPYTTRTSINKATGISAAVYYNEHGAYVIIDDVTREIVQISDSNNPISWIPDSSISDPYILIEGNEKWKLK